MTKFVCESCQYTLDKPKMPHRCPYCGKEGTMMRQKSAQDILDEVSENPQRFD